MINSPRSLQACEQLGVEPLELYQLTLDKFKEKYSIISHKEVNANSQSEYPQITCCQMLCPILPVCPLVSKISQWILSQVDLVFVAASLLFLFSI